MIALQTPSFPQPGEVNRARLCRAHRPATAREDARPAISSIQFILFIPVNPYERAEQKEAELEIYAMAQPCSRHTRLFVKIDGLRRSLLKGIQG
jgi:hypothetical protein